MQGVGYLAAAYAVVGVVLVAYALGLIRRERTLRRELGSTRGPGARGPG